MNNCLKSLRVRFSPFSSAAATASAIKKPGRFYKTVSVQKFEQDNRPRPHFGIKLDDRLLKSPAGRVLLLDSEPLIRLIANEWESQEKEINSGLMHLTGLAFTALDNPHSYTKQTLVTNMLGYLEGDTLLYYAESQGSLSDEQQRKWTPVIEWVNAEYHLDLKPTENPTGQPVLPTNSKARIERLLLAYKFPALIAINYATEAAKSLILPIAVIAQHLDVKTAVNLARLEQTYQTNIWGNVEWAHDMEYHETSLRFSSAMLFANFSSDLYKH